MAKRLWTAYEAASATGGMLCARGGDPNRWEAEEWSAEGISIDTRQLQPGDMFVALSDNRDGHDFVGHAFEAGASAALVARAPEQLPGGKPLLVVRDTLEGLRDLARAARLRNFGKRIAITGSAGKTSTKDMLRHMLTAEGEVHAADRSFNNHLGVPLTLARLPMSSKFSVFEIGMNHAGEITPLTDLVQPHAAIVTTVAPAHLEFFPNVEAIAEAKAEIFSGLKRGGTAVLPRDNAYYSILNERAEHSPAGQILTFGRDKTADMRLLSTAPREGGGQSVMAAFRGQEFSFPLALEGEHHASNALAAILAATSIGANAEVMLPTLGEFAAGKGRGEISKLILNDIGEVTLIDESYNANPASMAAALQTVAQTHGRNGGKARQIAVLGEMLELGDSASQFHEELAAPLKMSGVSRVYLTGDLMRALEKRLLQTGWRREDVIFRTDPHDLAEKLIADIHQGDMIMVKGSNGSKVNFVVKRLKMQGV